MVVEGLAFQRSVKTFDHGVVQRRSLSGHGDDDTVSRTHHFVLVCEVLCTLIRVEDESTRIICFIERLLQGVDNELYVIVLADFISDDIARF